MRRDDMALLLEIWSHSVRSVVRLRRILGRLVLVLTAIGALVVTYHVAFPIQDDLGDLQEGSDAIVSLAPHVKRLATTEKHLENNLAETLVISYFDGDATIGEAFADNEIAQHASWDAATVVTSRTHAFRARYIFVRCMSDDIDYNLVYADPDLNVVHWGWRIAYENAAFLKVLWQTSTRC